MTGHARRKSSPRTCTSPGAPATDATRTKTFSER